MRQGGSSPLSSLSSPSPSLPLSPCCCCDDVRRICSSNKRGRPRSRQQSSSSSSRAVQTLSAFLLLAFLSTPLHIIYSLRQFALVSESILMEQFQQYYPAYPPREVLYERVAFLDPSEVFIKDWEEMGNSTKDLDDDDDDEDRIYVRPMSSARRQELLEDSSGYVDGKPDDFEHDECVAQHEWQKLAYPTCTLFHEQDLRSFYRQERRQRLRNEQEKNKKKRKITTIITDTNHETVRIVAKGGWRDVWVLTPYNLKEEPSSSKYVLKTLRWKHRVTERTIDTHRIDSLAMERLTSSPHVMDIYGYCGTSGLFPFADGPDISQTMWPDGAEKDGEISREQYEASSKLHTKLELLHIAVQATMGLAAFHNFAKEGYPAIVHNDISPTQWIKIGDTYKLNDFNRARLLSWNPQNQTICDYYEGYNPGKRRSPEEYRPGPQTAMVDVFSLGNIFYILLMKQWPFKYYSHKGIVKAIAKGERPYMFPDVRNSTDPIDRTLLKAMKRCFPQDPKRRATARQVETYLKNKLREFDPGRLEAWGES